MDAKRHSALAVVGVALACLAPMAAFMIPGAANASHKAAAPTRTVTATATVTKTVTATATVTATVTAIVTATQTVTVTPTPSASGSPTPTTSAPPPPGFPDASNTGVPAGTTLTAYTGPANVSTANTVIDGKTIGCISVSAPGVVIRNSRISCGGGYAVFVDDRSLTSTQTPLLIEDSEISCANSNGTAVGEADVTARRVEITGCENGFDANQHITVEDSFIHNLYNGNAAHADGLQMASGHWNGTTYVCCSLNLTVRHNTILSADASGGLGTSAIISSRGGDVDILIEDNLLAGGAFTLYCEQGATGINYRVTGNHFSTMYSAKVGAFGPSTDCADETQSGNVYHETGQPLTLN